MCWETLFYNLNDGGTMADNQSHPTASCNVEVWVVLVVSGDPLFGVGEVGMSWVNHVREGYRFSVIGRGGHQRCIPSSVGKHPSP
jgi:hypothetical protein